MQIPTILQHEKTKQSVGVYKICFTKLNLQNELDTIKVYTLMLWKLITNLQWRAKYCHLVGVLLTVESEQSMYNDEWLNKNCNACLH